MPMPDLTPVQSSNIAAVGHDGDHLYVQFHGGSTWKYHNVPADQHAEMIKASSVGKFFGKHVKPNFKAEKVS